MEHRVPQLLLRERLQRGGERRSQEREVTLISTKKLLPMLSPIVPVTLIGVNNVVLFSERES